MLLVTTTVEKNIKVRLDVELDENDIRMLERMCSASLSIPAYLQQNEYIHTDDEAIAVSNLMESIYRTMMNLRLSLGIER